MSRIGREPIAVPAGVTITIADGNNVAASNGYGYACGNGNKFSTNS